MKRPIRTLFYGITHEHAEGKFATLMRMPDEFEIVGVVDDRPRGSKFYVDVQLEPKGFRVVPRRPPAVRRFRIGARHRMRAYERHTLRMDLAVVVDGEVRIARAAEKRDTGERRHNVQNGVERRSVACNLDRHIGTCAGLRRAGQGRDGIGPQDAHGAQARCRREGRN